MESANGRWIPPLLIAAAITASMASAPMLPATVVIDFERLLPVAAGASAEAAPRWLVLYSVPAVALCLWLLFRIVPTRAGERLGRTMFRNAPGAVTSPEQFARFGGTYETIVLGVVMLLLGLHAGMLAAALGAYEVAMRAIPAVFGGALVMMGNVIPRLKPNWVAGVRTRHTLADPDLWRRTHRSFGAAFVVGGLVTVVTAMIAPRFGLLLGIAAVLVACIVGFVASRPGRIAAPAVLALIGAFAPDLGAQMAPIAQIVELPTPATVVESPYSFSRDGFIVHGSLARPANLADGIPVVVIVAGSGPTDRNANGPLINTNAYAMLAWALAEHGIASLRYDKRGIGQSAGPKDANPTTLTLDVYVADLHAAAQALAADRRFSSVILLGHSEGAGLSIQAANRGAPVSRVIMVSPQGRKFRDLVREQFARVTDSATVARIDTAFSRLLRGEDPGDVPPIAQSLFVPGAANFLRSFAAYDPPAEAQRFPGPLLIVQGATDIQTTMEDARILAAAQPRATLVELPGVNHVLKEIESTSPQHQLSTYRDPHLPLAPSVATTIVRWIRAPENQVTPDVSGGAP
jgi:pimeloyl-ACP methyl ester carboxylesterase